MNLHGTIPSWLGAELRHLRVMLFHDNAFTGTVPESTICVSVYQLFDLHKYD